MVLFLVPMLNSCHRHMHCAPVSWSNQWWLVQVLPTEFLPISSFAQLGSGLSHSFITVISLCLLVLTEIWAAVHIWDSHSDDGYTSQFIHWQISSDYTSHDAKEKVNQSFLSRFCNIIGAALQKTQEKRTVCLYCWNYFWSLPVSILYMELLSLSLEAPLHSNVLSHLSFSSLSKLKCVKQAPLSLGSSQKPAFIPSRDGFTPALFPK